MQGPPATPEGFWNDIRDRDSSVEWDPDVDLTQAGQCIGAIDEIKHAADLVEELMDELIGTLHTLGNVGAQVPQEARLSCGCVLSNVTCLSQALL